MTRPVRIANCSGFYGDRHSAAREMVEGGPIDVLTGDYLAELTMLILWKAKQKDAGKGYALTFLSQMEEVLGTCLDRGIRIVSNAGGLDPAGLADDLGALARRIGLAPRIGYVVGDDIMEHVDQLQVDGHPFRHLDKGRPLSEADVRPVTANAYLGGWGIAAALAGGADIVVCPRVTDASLVVGPSAWWHEWDRQDFDRLAGAVIAGHVIECGPQATGGNYSWLQEIVDRRFPGFPIAEIAHDGASVITKHPGTGGLVSVGTVTAQLLYEIDRPAYANPDVVAAFDSVALEQIGPDRVRITGALGAPPPDTLKVAMNLDGGYRNTMTMVLTGLDIDDKAEVAERELFEILGGRESFDDVDVQLLRFDHQGADSNVLCTAHLRITVKDRERERVGRRFSNATMQLALGGYAGFHTTTPPTDASAFGVYWPTTVPAGAVDHVAVLPGGARVPIPHTPGKPRVPVPAATAPDPSPTLRSPHSPGVPTVRRPLGAICGARSGDKGGNANVGLWTRSPEEFAWLEAFLSVDRFVQLVPEAVGLTVDRYVFWNLCALNFVVIGLLGEGVASSVRPDPQAKGFGEFVRSRPVDIPAHLIADGG